MPMIPSIFLLLKLFMVWHLLFSCLVLWFATAQSSADGQLWVLVRVSNGSELPPQHHRMIFVDCVVTVHRIPSQEVPEAEKQFDLSIVLQPDHVFATFVDQRAISGRHPVNQ